MLNQHRIQFCCSTLVFLAITAGDAAIRGQEKDFDAYSDHVSGYLKRLYDPSGRELAYRDDYPGGFEKWQTDARSALRLKLGLDKIAASVGDHKPTIELGEAEKGGEFTRQRGLIETEPNVQIPFWLLKPKTKGKRPLGVFPHGHDRRGPETTAGVYADEAHERNDCNAAQKSSQHTAVMSLRVCFHVNLLLWFFWVFVACVHAWGDWFDLHAVPPHSGVVGPDYLMI